MAAHEFRDRPVVIQAVQWLNRKIMCPPGPMWFFEAEAKNQITLSGRTLSVHTLEGVMDANPGDWIVRGVKGALYTCKDDVFRETYQPVNDEAGDCDGIPDKALVEGGVAELMAAAEQALGALVGAMAADDSVQGRARQRLLAAINRVRGW